MASSKAGGEMKCILLTLLQVACFSSALCIDAVAANPDYPKKPFDAIWDVISKPGNPRYRITSFDWRSRRIVSDGKGHVRAEIALRDGRNKVAIADFPNGVMYIVIDQLRTVMKLPLDPITFEDSPVDTAVVKTKNAQPLGAKLVNGYPCHGWRYSEGEGTDEVWIGDDIGYEVESTSKFGDAQSTFRLRSYSGQAPNASLFRAPAGYAVIDGN